jgi:hypothetical protein
MLSIMAITGILMNARRAMRDGESGKYFWDQASCVRVVMAELRPNPIAFVLIEQTREREKGSVVL